MLVNWWGIGVTYLFMYLFNIIRPFHSNNRNGFLCSCSRSLVFISGGYLERRILSGVDPFEMRVDSRIVSGVFTSDVCRL